MAMKDLYVWVKGNRAVVFAGLVLAAELVLLFFGLRVLLVVNALAALLWWSRGQRR